jgi:hypothetical protein
MELLAERELVLGRGTSFNPASDQPAKSPSVAFARVNMFKSAVVSDCLMMTGKFAGHGLYGGHVPRDQRPQLWNRGRRRLSGVEGGEGRFS